MSIIFVPIVARYLIETFYDKVRNKGGLYDAAKRMADEQSLSIKGVSEKFRSLIGTSDLSEYEAKILRVEVISKKDLGDKTLYLGIVEIAYPDVHFLPGASFMNILTYVVGDLMDSVYLKSIRLLSVDFSEALLNIFGGPKKADDLRKLRGKGPYLALIMKPSLGLSPEQYAKISYHVAKAGIHMITDDEKLADPSYCRRIERAREILRAIRKAGSHTVYFVNASSIRPVEAISKILEELDTERLGVLIPSTYSGYDVINDVRREFDIPIYTRNSGFSTLTEGPRSVSHEVLAYLERVAGSDIVQIPPPVGVHKKDIELVIAAKKALEKDIGIMRSIPLIGAGIHPTRAYRAVSLGFKDVIFLVGGAIVGHPHGPEAGVKAMFDAFEGALEGKSVNDLIEESEAFREAYEKRGERDDRA